MSPRITTVISILAIAGSTVPVPGGGPASRGPAPPAAAGAPEVEKQDGKTASEWIAVWKGNNYTENRKAQRALVALGEASVKPLLALLHERDPRMGLAIQVLAELGPAARPALPMLKAMAREAEGEAPAGWTWNVSPRRLALGELGRFTWAADELVTLLEEVAVDAGESEDIRRTAAGSLTRIGRAAVPALRRLTASEVDSLRETAHYGLAKLLGQQNEEYFTAVLNRHPLDPNAPAYLAHCKGTYNSGRLDALTERVKANLRSHWKKTRDLAVAWTLIEIIQDQLRGTALQWAAPTDSSSSRTDRENPKESFVTLAAIARPAFEAAERGSDMWRKLGTGLAKLRLLQGDWDGMNRVLEELGEDPVPAGLRGKLPAPPGDWSSGLAKRWGVADESMRSGSCSLVVRVQRLGKGLRGAHVLLKELPRQDPARFRTGIRTDTLFLAPFPYSRFGRFDSFGYSGGDRARTRYGVTDETGVLRFNGLPEMEVKIEVLIPTSNFPDAGKSWELWMEVEKGKFQVAATFPGPNTVSTSSEVARVKLSAGTVTEYPRLVVRPRLAFNLLDWAQMDRKSSVVTWTPLDDAIGDASDAISRYELALSVSAPAQDPEFVQSTPVLRTERIDVTGNSWPLAQKGVGELRLEPGNIYLLELTAYDRDGAVVARCPRTRVWVPWEHRTTDGPVMANSRIGSVPIFHGGWWRQASRVGDGREIRLREKVEIFLREHPRALEREYVKLGEFWLDWRDGDIEKARKGLSGLVKTLPEGNVVHATAQTLVESMDAGHSCPKRLQFTP